MNDCLVSGLGGTSESDGLFRLAVDAEARMTSVEQQTADRGPAVSADDDVGNVEIVLDADEDDDEDDGDAPAVGGEVSEAARLREAEK